MGIIYIVIPKYRGYRGKKIRGPLLTIKKHMSEEGDIQWFWVLLYPHYLKTKTD